MKRREFLHCSAITVAAASLVSSGSASAAEETPKLQFNADGKFKIAQFTDTHYRLDKQNDCIEAVRLIEETLEAEKPQLAVYTGDIVVGGDTRKGWDDILAPCIDRKVPYAVMLGNHDHENTKIPRRDIAAYIAGKPFSLTQLCPQEIYGATNYVLEIYDKDKVANLIYCLDSNAYPPPPYKGAYDWFHDEQIAWYRKQSRTYTEQNGGTPIPALAFFHIPLNEFGEMIHHQAVLATGNMTEYAAGNIIQVRRDNRMKAETRLVGQRFEIECPGAVNSGMFYAMWSQKDVMGIFVGHDHVNDYIGLHQNIALGFGRWSGSKTTYGGKYMTHGSRLFELKRDGGRMFKTWIRQRGGGIFYTVQVPADLLAEK
ncbi:MAG: metallophosphoesterase family protein [Planctomycetaceae bacterium]|nr:metallophosphoesterase family protein [Planctomycetaceae bacterium]